MENYDENNCCPKCESMDSSTEYWDGMPDVRMYGIFGGPPDDFYPEPKMIRTCKRCGYKRFEKPLDSDDE